MKLKSRNITKKEQERIESQNRMKLHPCIKLNELKNYEGTEKPSIFCEEDQLNSLMTIDSFPRHYLMKRFGLTLQQYYDKWYKKADEGVCPICGKHTNFFGINGYAGFCSKLVHEKILNTVIK